MNRFIFFTLCLAVTMPVFSALASNNIALAKVEADRIEHVVSVDVKSHDDQVHLLLGKQIAGRDSVWYQSSLDAGETWSEAVEVSAGLSMPMRMSRGNDARLAVYGDQVFAVWMTKKEGAPHNAGPMMAMVSEDGGQTWHETSPADWEGAHGFFAVDASKAGIGLVWLDSRSRVGGGATQGLRYANSTDGGKTWSTNQTLDERSCACCWNTARYHDNELYVLYRDKDPSDMTLGKVTTTQQWQDLGTVGQFNWDFQGCPHIGGSVAFDGDMIHSTVGTAHPDHTGIYYLRSEDQGKTWSSPMQMGGETAVHSDLDARHDHVVMAWDRITETGFEVVVNYSLDKGQQWATDTLVSASGVGASHPRVIALADKALILWTEGQAKQAKTLRIQSISLP